MGKKGELGLLGKIGLILLGGLIVYGSLHILSSGFTKDPFARDSTSSSISAPTTTITIPSSTTNSATASITATPDLRKDLVVYDLRNTSSGTAINAVSLAQLLNDDTDVFNFQAEGYIYESLYRDNGGLRFGTSSKAGILKLVFAEGVTFDNMSIRGYAYNSENPTTSKWNCDEAGAEIDTEISTYQYSFPTNNGEYRAPEEGYYIVRDSAMEYVDIHTSPARFTLVEIEFWNE